MGDSYRIKTELGINKTINVQLDQEYEFLEILSLKLQQEDIYIRACADYGVAVGRITANNGFGLPNARVSVFIPIDSIDESNPIISSIYPYKSPSDKNEDGYRYNLLPYEKSYTKHAATGTLPSRLDVLTGNTAIEIYDKYYKFTSKTNESGDYMIMGVPLGYQTLVMDVDLSDIGEFSLTPQDLIRMGLATEAQVAGNQFRTSNDLNSLPQIISITKNTEISPLWGDPGLCDISINRIDFDLRDDANVDIKPTAVFMGSMFSTLDTFRVRKNCRPKDNMGNLCGLTTSPGQILAIRQTINQDIDGNPVLEQFQLEQAGNIIDGNGTWLTELPMNLDYYVTNQYGEKVLSYDPTIGIPTKAKYRFKVKWQQPNDLTQQTRRAYYLVPNVREYGWQNSLNDPLYSSSQLTKNKLSSSYYFGLAWSGYTNGFLGTEKTERLNDCINGEDTFYEFQYNRVYTVSSLIDEFKKGAKGRFIGIKEIDDDSCGGTVNKFPVNDGFRNFDLLFFLFSILFTLAQPALLSILVVAHILIWLYNLILEFLCWLSGVGIKSLKWYPFRRWKKYCGAKKFIIRLPMITYPDCQACDCNSNTLGDVPAISNGAPLTGSLSYVSSPIYYDAAFQNYFSADTENGSNLSIIYSQAISGLDDFAFRAYPTNYKLPLSQNLQLSTGKYHHASSKDLTMGERINLFNQRKDYFFGKNRMTVTFAKESNVNKTHYDNSITVLSTQQFNAGELLTFINASGSTDVNYLYSANTANGVVTGISGTSITGTGATKVNVSFADPGVQSQTSDLTVEYNLPYGSAENNYKFPADIEYYQVVTAITVSDASKIWNKTTPQAFPDLLNSPTTVYEWQSQTTTVYNVVSTKTFNPSEFYEGFGEQYILILQRGVDPYSPKYANEYKLGSIFGTNDSDPNWTFTAETRLNIPIQKLNNTSVSVQPYSQSESYYGSYFFKPGVFFNTTSTTSYQLGTSPGTLTVATGLSYVEDQYIKVEHNSLNFEYARVQSYDVTTGKLVFDTITGFTGNGIYNSWSVSLYEGNVENQPGGVFSAFTTTNTAYYGLLDSQTSPQPPRSTISGNQVITQTSNGFYDGAQNSSRYDSSEDVSGMGIMSCANYSSTQNLLSTTPSNYVSTLNYYYYTKSLFAGNPNLYIGTPGLNVLRTDRLPTSDILDGGSWDNNPAMLQQNNAFGIYLLNTDGNDITSQAFSTGADQVTPDIEGQPNSLKVLESFNCESMVGLKCYEGFGSTFKINENCTEVDAVENGCYLFLRRPLIDLGKDIKSFGEWGFRFRFFYGICRGVLSQSFVNNWINGALYMFPIQVDTRYDKQNKPEYPRFCYNLAYFDDKTNNFYYRSSPYNENTNRFVGMKTNNKGSVNDLNLLFPTTIINLGIKDSFYSEIVFEPSTKGYVIPNINPTSYGDTSDLLNLFVISRITDENILAQIISLGDNSLNQLFSRPEKRIDGDLAQLMSINSEIGNINFSPEFYDTTGGPPTTILGSSKYPVMAVWFSSTTQDLQTKDYLTPGRINFRGPNNVGWNQYPYGIKSQIVPFYQWKLDNTNTIFGNENNTWATSTSDIIQNTYYQGLDRATQNTKYFQNQSAQSNDLYARGYIFSVDGNGNYISDGAISDKFLVGAPYQFYFGVVKGESALDKFKTKYSISE